MIKRKFFYSRHARRQMKWRKITNSEVEDTIISPEKVEDSIMNRKNAYKHIGERYIKVTFKEKDDIIIIITAMDKT